MRRIIIEAAVSGATKDRNRNTPRTITELTADIAACIEAGAAIVHNHLENFSFTGRKAAQRYGTVWAPVLERYPDAILIPTLTAPVPGDRLGNYRHVVAAISHGASLAPIDPGSVNMAASLPDGQPDPARSIAFVNAYDALDGALDLYAAHVIPASISIWDPSFLRAAMAYERAGRFAMGSFLKLFFGGRHSYLDGHRGISFGLPPTVEALDIYLQMMAGSRLPWAAAVIGDDILAESDFAAAVVDRGGHLRVGLEDYAEMDAPSNRELVERAASFAAGRGRTPATISDARAMLGLVRTTVTPSGAGR